jgi:hypothetical protein
MSQNHVMTTASARITFESTFKAFERLLKNLETTGGRILLLFLLVMAGYGGAACGFPRAEELGGASLIVLLLVLGRNPRSSGFLAGLLSIFKGNH